MLALRMIRNAISTLFLLLTLCMIGLRAAPIYLSPEANAKLQEAVAKATALATGRPMHTAPGQSPDPGDLMSGSHADLMRQLDRVREGMRNRQAAAPAVPDPVAVESLPPPRQPHFQPSARPAYGGVAPRTTGPKVIRVGE